MLIGFSRWRAREVGYIVKATNDLFSGGFGLQRVRQWPEELGSLEWVSDGVWFLAAKNAKVTKAVSPKPETRNQKLTNQQAKPFYRRGTMHGEEGAGDS